MSVPARCGRAFAAAMLAVATLGARPAVHVSETAPPLASALTSAEVMTKYARALRKIERPVAISFDYSVEQLGLVNMEQTHHVYRSGRSERDETIVVDGYTLKRPSVRILANRTARYDIGAVAPQPSAYRFTFSGAVERSSGYTYVYRTESRSPRDFSVTEIELDGVRFLPAIVRFKIGGGGARGSGELTFVPNGRYWVVREANVSAHLTNGTTAHERIVWSGYSFPSELPPSTFQPPNAHASEDLEIPTTPTPEPPPGP